MLYLLDPANATIEALAPAASVGTVLRCFLRLVT